MKIEKIYRLAIDEYDTPTTDFYTSKEEALSQLEDFKELLREEDYMGDGFEFGTSIILQCFSLNTLDDIYDECDTEDTVSEWVIDKDYTYDYQKDRAVAGITTEEVFGMWKDYEVK
ncbi:hypothetical protein [Peptostreptococcus porci]|uniref:hypothetical protein n=1 Tax=Peptostreptococcus porci TaxID=2652282 RepID=UPI002A8021EC|nr:hypothetical protein [Peptostreptococcus porci]MDY4128827.1 hypothetical protein [Peptostreptococcus porci]MDY6232805.1 hypothetical protein [Peptostreptococcus porci]